MLPAHRLSSPCRSRIVEPGRSAAGLERFGDRVIVVSNRMETRQRDENSIDSTAMRANTVSVLFETKIANIPDFYALSK